jgi:hypothetical protein
VCIFIRKGFKLHGNLFNYCLSSFFASENAVVKSQTM